MNEELEEKAAKWEFGICLTMQYSEPVNEAEAVRLFYDYLEQKGLDVSGLRTAPIYEPIPYDPSSGPTQEEFEAFDKAIKELTI